MYISTRYVTRYVWEEFDSYGPYKNINDFQTIYFRQHSMLAQHVILQLHGDLPTVLLASYLYKIVPWQDLETHYQHI